MLDQDLLINVGHLDGAQWRRLVEHVRNCQDEERTLWAAGNALESDGQGEFHVDGAAIFAWGEGSKAAIDDFLLHLDPRCEELRIEFRALGEPGFRRLIDLARARPDDLQISAGALSIEDGAITFRRLAVTARGAAINALKDLLPTIADAITR